MAGLNNTLTESLRDYLLDREELNQLNLNEVELADPDLQGAVKDGIIAYDLTLPLSTTDISAIDTEGKTWYYIKRLATIEALQRLVFLHVRNRNPVNDQGFKVDKFSKASDWKLLKDGMITDLQSKVERYKRALDLQSFSGVSSVSFQDDYV